MVWHGVAWHGITHERISTLHIVDRPTQAGEGLAICVPMRYTPFDKPLRETTGPRRAMILKPEAMIAMKIFIDSATLSEIEEAYAYGFLDGVTTNPSLIKKAMDGLKAKGESVDMETYIREILETAKGTPVSLEVTDRSYEKMVEQGMTLYQRFNDVADNVTIKIPVCPAFEGASGDVNPFDGLRAIKSLTEEDVPVNCTLVFTPEQALLAAKAGSTYVSPFAGRVDDRIRTLHNIDFDKRDYFPGGGVQTPSGYLEDDGIHSGIDLITKIVAVMREHDLETKVLAASIRSARQAREAALAGADIATLPLYVIKSMVGHYKTREGMERFTADCIDEYVALTR